MILGLSLFLAGCKSKPLIEEKILNKSIIANETRINQEAKNILTNTEQIRKYYGLSIYDTIAIRRPIKYGEDFSIMFCIDNRKQVYTYKDTDKNGKYDEV